MSAPVRSPAAPVTPPRRHRSPAGTRRGRGAGRLAGWVGVLILVAAVAGLLAWPRTEAPVSPPAEGRQMDAAATARSLKLMNYYPSAGSWQRMWLDWSSATFDADMYEIARLGAGTVRLVVFPEVFGYPTPNLTMAARLESAMSIAHRRGLTVQLTLFDDFVNYADIEGSSTWATKLLSRYRDDTRISIVEVRNEIDPWDAVAMSWARSQIRLVGRLLPDTPVTISTSSESRVEGLLQLQQALRNAAPDVYSLHYYGAAALAYDTFRRAAEAVAPSPLVLGEVGHSTTREESGSAGRRAREAEQASWYRVVQSAARAAGLAPAAPWTLYDFTSSGTPEQLPPAEYGFGLLRSDGTRKPAASVVSAAFAGRLTADPYNGDFTDLVDGDRAAGWTPWMLTGSARVEEGEGVDGGNALVFSGTERQDDAMTSWYTVPARPVRPGEVWTVTVSARGSAASGTNDVALAWFDQEGNWLSNAGSNPLELDDDDWQELVATSPVPADARAVEIHLRSSGNEGQVAYSQVSWTVAEE
jgi:hypothetical protein